MIVWGKIYKSKYNHCLSYYWTKETRKTILLWCFKMLFIQRIRNKIYRMMSLNIINYLKTRLRSFLKCWKSSYHSKLVTMRKHTSNKTFQGYIFLFVIQFERWQMFRFSYDKMFLFLLTFYLSSVRYRLISSIQYSLLYLKILCRVRYRYFAIWNVFKEYGLHLYRH